MLQRFIGLDIEISSTENLKANTVSALCRSKLTSACCLKLSHQPSQLILTCTGVANMKSNKLSNDIPGNTIV